MSKEYKVIIEDDVLAAKLEASVCRRFSFNEYILRKKKANPEFSISTDNFIEDRIMDFLISSGINGQQKLDYEEMAKEYNSLKTKRE